MIKINLLIKRMRLDICRKCTLKKINWSFLVKFNNKANDALKWYNMLNNICFGGFSILILTNSNNLQQRFVVL